MSINLKKKDTSKHLPRAFYLFRPAADWEALQSSYSLGLKAVCHAFDWLIMTIQRIGNLNG